MGDDWLGYLNENAPELYVQAVESLQRDAKQAGDRIVDQAKRIKELEAKLVKQICIRCQRNAVRGIGKSC